MAGEEPLDQVLGGRATRRPRVEPTEEDLDQRPRDLGRERALVGLVKAADVERPRVAQRGRGDARGERVVDVNDVEVDAAEQALERLADINRQRRGAGPRPAWHRDPAAERENAGALALEQRRRVLLGFLDRRPRLANGAPRIRRRRDHHPVATLDQLGGDPGDEVVDLVPHPPGMWGHLGDGEAFTRGHRLRIRSTENHPITRIGEDAPVEGVRKLDPQAAGDHLDRLYRAALALSGSPQIAEDLVQETYLKVLARPRFLRRDNELGYLLKALRNTWYSQLRSRASRPRESELSAEDVASERRIGDPGLSLETSAVLAAIAALPDEFRDVVAVIDVAGLSYAEAAKALELAEGTVMSRLSRGRSRVAAALAEEGQG